MASPDKEAPPRGPRLICVGSGRGGVGSSLCASNIAVFLAQIGKKVTLIDANLPDSGLAAWLGYPPVEGTFADALVDGGADFSARLCGTQIAGLSFLPGGADLLNDGQYDHQVLDLLTEGIRTLNDDYVVIDLPSGIHALSLYFLGITDLPVVVTVGTPDAVEALYRMLKAVFIHQLLHDPRMEDGDTLLLRDVASNHRALLSPRAVSTLLKREGSLQAGKLAEKWELAFHPLLVINKIRVKSDESLGDAMVAATSRWLGIVARVLGTIDWDDNVWLSLRRGIPLLIDFPQSRACRGLERIVRQLMAPDARVPRTARPIPPSIEKQNMYELLDLYPGASEEEIRRGLKQVKEYFGISGMAARGACSEADREEYLRRVHLAHECLVDKSKRRDYDRAQFPEGFSPSQGGIRKSGEDIPRKPKAAEQKNKVALRDDQMVTGKLLGQLRQELGIDLEDISNRAKISVAYLRAIEEERYSDLPEMVYVRGFITEFARYLRIEPVRAVEDFIATHDAAMVKKKR